MQIKKERLYHTTCKGYSGLERDQEDWASWARWLWEWGLDVGWTRAPGKNRASPTQGAEELV